MWIADTILSWISLMSNVTICSRSEWEGICFFFMFLYNALHEYMILLDLLIFFRLIDTFIVLKSTWINKVVSTESDHWVLRSVMSTQTGSRSPRSQAQIFHISSYLFFLSGDDGDWKHRSSAWKAYALPLNPWFHFAIQHLIIQNAHLTGIAQSAPHLQLWHLCAFRCVQVLLLPLQPTSMMLPATVPDSDS